MTAYEPEAEHRLLLQSVVETARAIFDAQASSIFLLDEADGALVFEAVSGKGEGDLVGRRFPAGRGVAGWVLQSRQPIEVDDVDEDERFARDLAESTDYVPRALMAAPLLHGDEVLGVLEVLDRSREVRTTLAAMDLLALFSAQASVALRLVRHGRRTRPAEGGPGADALGAEELGAERLVRALAALRGERREAGRRLVGALEELLSGEG
ncbi:GAF domain-containing protein [Streptomyces sp. Rer75]|uniref:GAF domain-containing protein n=1 Tax=unclassified Streptomyces TaxID=2593676 RepID=UPI0015CFF4C8|nr:GAF domain-containing protein [Streptomyces sp. Rer75]QLH24725.1 GAF domain-containing protein [Streptomyces sp. Rer75]